MKKRPLLFVSLSVLIAAITFLSVGNSSQEYTPRHSNELTQNYEGAEAHFKKLRANPETGEIDYAIYRSIQNEERAYRAEKGQSTIGLEWDEVGPDNFGGRTRAILITEDDVMYAGGTTGGLFKSTNGGNTWARVTSFDKGFFVSCIAQLGNGHIYIGTGNSAEIRSNGNSGLGNGLFVSTDDGLTWDWALDGNGDPIRPDDIGGGDYSVIDAIVADPNVDNKLWVGSNVGLQPYVEGTGFLPEPDGLPSGDCESLAISGDGSVIAASMGSSNFYLSTDGGVTFEDRAGNGVGEIPSNVTRLIVAISPDNPDYIYGAVATGSPGSFGGVYGSNNGGETFEVVWPGDVDEVRPDRTNSAFPVAWYGLAIAVVPNSPGLFVLGCLDVWVGGFSSQPEQKSFWGLSEFSPGFPALDGTIYCHADICTFAFNDDGTLYVGTDGGVFRTSDGANSFTSTNRFYNVTQFYSIGISGDDKVLGGAQDNGSIYVTKTQSTTSEGISVAGGDGMGCDVSSLNPNGNIIFTSTPRNIVSRSFDGGTISMVPMITFAMSTEPAPFVSQVKLWESGDANTPYPIPYVNFGETTLEAGTEVVVSSNVYEYSYNETLTDDLAPGDTAVFMDKGASLFSIGYTNSGGIYVTREATSFSGSVNWAKVKSYVNGSVTTMEWSHADGNYLWVGTDAGRIYRISGFANAWDVADMQIGSPDYALSIDSISLGNFVYISDIAIDPNDEDHVLYSRAGFGGSAKLWESTNATSDNFSFSNVWFDSSDPLAGMPVYTCLIEMSDPNTFIVGTEYGIYATDNGGADWSPENTEPLAENVIYDIRQQTMDPSLVSNAGYIYIGSYGRGAFKSTTYEKNLIGGGGISGADSELVNGLVISPNPMNEMGWLRFESNENANVEMDIYSLNGQKVKSLQLSIKEGANNISFNVNDLSEGTYILQLQKDDKYTTDKFVIIR